MRKILQYAATGIVVIASLIVGFMSVMEPYKERPNTRLEGKAPNAPPLAAEAKPAVPADVKVEPAQVVRTLHVTPPQTTAAAPPASGEPTPDKPSVNEHPAPIGAQVKTAVKPPKKKVASIKRPPVARRYIDPDSYDRQDRWSEPMPQSRGLFGFPTDE